jgi:hypothetical protein
LVETPAGTKRGIGVAEDTLKEIRDLLVEVRDLLRPVADAHQEAYDRREAAREEERNAAIQALLSTDKRKKAWALMDGTRTQSEIVKGSGMTQSGVSMFLKSLRELGAVDDSSKPARKVDVSV